MKRKGRAVRVAVVGAGFAAGFHLESYARVHGVDLEVVGIASRTEAKARALAEQHGIPQVYPDLAAVLADDAVNVVDLCVPVSLHKGMTIAAARAGKHVICEKPLTGYLGPATTPRLKMYHAVLADLWAIRAAIAASRVHLLYAENWIYAPSIRRARELIAVSGGAILEIRGHEAHSGSASPYARRWETSGGGSLLRLGIHPLTVALHLKRREGERRSGRPIGVREVFCQVADLTRSPSFQAADAGWLATGWEDVENWTLGVLTFEDDTVAVISASDIALGGLQSSLDVSLTNASIRCNLSPNDTCTAYAPSPEVFAGVFLNEKIETPAGRSLPAVDHDWNSGYQQELQDFAEAVAYDRPPLSGLDLAEEAVRVAYALYLAAERGQQLTLSELAS